MRLVFILCGIIAFDHGWYLLSDGSWLYPNFTAQWKPQPTPTQQEEEPEPITWNPWQLKE